LTIFILHPIGKRYTSISTHQNINVYGKPKKKYEVRIARLAVDVRLLVHDD
jgi:hypothetical protein